MSKIKKLVLNEYCGYREAEFDFTHEGKVLPLAVYFGPNGSGKSTVLNAIRLLTTPHENIARETELAFRKLTYDPDFIVDYQGYHDPKFNMHMEAVFETEDGDQQVVIESDGVKKAELPRKLHGHSYYIDADNPLHMRRFQIDAARSDDFLKMAKAVYGYDCHVERKVEDEMTDPITGEILETISVYTDLVLDKPYLGHGNTKVHFKSMSDGERKIATLLSYLFDPCYMDGRDIILIDNLELHIYYKRHAALVDLLLRLFPDKQFIVTTHSGTLINHVATKYGKKCLFDLEELRSGVVSLDEWAY